ncbi:PAS domain S-box protein [Ferruginibacter sp. HRS2-29]|uniref:PAS domain S-box protein n=1 Tax=Ferruginibacter sp. HRS2-29 TaxID=2487334 RepID=UPI0020CFDA56|nr:PAS domain S-box protein [Ferruginibacter sp. HRS2-29]MCP9749656.1 PAS domain S-box protein [Ferruginibacter sp. HRS2-29]
MNKNKLIYAVLVLLFLSIAVFSYRAYQEVLKYAGLANRHNSVLSAFLNLSRDVNNAAVLDPRLVEISRGEDKAKMFYTDSLAIFQQLDVLQTIVRDTENMRTAGILIPLVRREFAWIYSSNVPDSIRLRKSAVHLANYRSIDSLISSGTSRTKLLIELRKTQFNTEIKKLSRWVLFFLAGSGMLLLFTTFRLLRQKKQRLLKEKELANVFHRITDSVVSVDNQWRYTFLNDAALSTHPLSLEQTLGLVMWDVHPAMHGTIFYDKFHEAMSSGKVQEVEGYYEPMDTWFSVKVYPSDDGLTIFYKNITGVKRAELQLSKSLKEVSDYKYALDESSIMAITDAAGLIEYVNDNFCKISGFSREELIGRDHSILSSGYHSKKFISAIWNTIATGKVWKGELKNKAKDGTVFWVDTSIVPFLNDAGKPYQYVAINSDITERKKIGEQQELSASIINSSDDAIISKTLDGIITSWNKGAEKIFKYKSSEIIGQNILKLVPPGFEEEEAVIVGRIRGGSIIDHYETKRLCKDGQLIDVSLTISPIKNQAGQISGASKICRNITLQKDAERKLVQSEKIYKTIASSIPGSVICLLDTNFNYQLIEGDMMEKLGFSKEQLLGKNIYQSLPAYIADPLAGHFQKVLEGQTVTVESSRQGYDVISRYIPLKNEQDAVNAIMTVTIDVTPLKAAHRNISELNHVLEKRIEERTVELKKSNEELEAFSYSVSHDLRAPLRAVYGYANILEEDYQDKLDEEGKRLLHEVQGNARKMGMLIDDLLSFSRLGRKKVEKSWIDMNVLVADVVQDILQHSGFKAAINLADLLPVKGDRGLMQQVMFNLLSNAFKYSSKREKSVISVMSRVEKNNIVYSVTDNGAGFDMKYVHKLFGVFQRLHSEEDFTGTGVGLAIVKRIIQKHRGEVWAESEEGVRTTFYFSLPQYPPLKSSTP